MRKIPQRAGSIFWRGHVLGLMFLSRALILVSLALAAGRDFVQSWLGGSLITPGNRLSKLFSLRYIWGFPLADSPSPLRCESSYKIFEIIPRACTVCCGGRGDKLWAHSPNVIKATTKFSRVTGSKVPCGRNYGIKSPTKCSWAL